MAPNGWPMPLGAGTILSLLAPPRSAIGPAPRHGATSSAARAINGSVQEYDTLCEPYRGQQRTAIPALAGILGQIQEVFSNALADLNAASPAVTVLSPESPAISPMNSSPGAPRRLWPAIAG